MEKIQKQSAADGNGTTIRLTGELGIEDAADLKQAFAEALAGPSPVTIDLEQVQALDLTVVQLICSACKTAALRGQSFLPAGEAPESQKEFLKTIGAKVASVCDQNNKQQCSWFGGEQ